MELLLKEIFANYKDGNDNTEKIALLISTVTKDIIEIPRVIRILFKKIQNQYNSNNDDYLKNIYTLYQYYMEDYQLEEVNSEIKTLYKNNMFGLERLGFSDYKELGYTGYEVHEMLRLITKGTMPHLSEESLGGIDIWHEKTKLNEERMISIAYNKKMIGYVTVDFISKRNYKEALYGELDETDLDNFKLEDENEYYLYFNTITVLSKWRNYKSLMAICDAFIEMLADFAKRKIVFREMLAVTCTKEGVNLCKMFDMKPIIRQENGEEVYGIKLLPIDKDHTYLKRYPTIIETYSEYYELHKSDKNSLIQLFKDKINKIKP